MANDRFLAIFPLGADAAAHDAPPAGATRPSAAASPPARLFDRWPDALLRFDVALRVVYANVAVERALALSRSEFVGRTVAEVPGFSAYAPLWASRLQAVLETGEERSFKFLYPHPCGHKRFDVLLMLEPAAPDDADGTTGPHVTAMLRDATVPRTAIQLARNADATLDAMIGTAQIGMGVLDRGLRYVQCNAHLERLLGRPDGGVLGKRPDQLAALPLDEPTRMAPLERMRAGTLRVTHEIEIAVDAGGEGQPAWLRLRRTPLFDARGDFDGVFVTAEPIDRARFAETSLAALRQALDSAGEMVLEIRRDGTVVDANETALTWLGYAREQIRGMALSALDAALSPAVHRRMIAALDAQGAFRGEGRYRTRGGAEFPVDVVVQQAVHGAREFLFVLARDITDRKRIENDLAAQITERRVFEEQLQVALRDQQTLLETMSVGVAQTHDGKILLANREFAQMFGYDDVAVIGMPLWDLCRETQGDGVSGLPVVRPRETTAAEVVLYRRDGEARWCLVQARAIDRAAASRPLPGAVETSEAAGATTGVEAIYTFQDISESKRQRETLARSLLELNVVLDATDVAVLHLDEEGRIQRGNAPAFAILRGHSDEAAPEADGLASGLPSGALLGRAFATLFVSPAEFAAQRERMRAHLATGRPWSFEAQLMGRIGTGRRAAAELRPFWAWITLRAVDAQVRGMIVSILNVSERKRQEQQLQQLLIESQLIFDTALVGLLFVRDGRPVRANAAMEELLGCEPGALVDQLQLFAHPTDQLLAASLARHYADIDEEGACEFELHMFRRRGAPIWVAVQGRAVDPDRTDLGYIFAFVDIDERKRSERELRATLNELQLIFDNALVSMIYVEGDRIAKTNAATERMFGLPERELRDRPVGTLFAGADDWPGVLRSLSLAAPSSPASAPPTEAEEPQLDVAAGAGPGAPAAPSSSPSPLAAGAPPRTEARAGGDAGASPTGAAARGPAAARGERRAAREVAFERQMRRSDGVVFWCAATARPIDPAAPERGVILVLMDVDQRRRSEDELRRVRNYLDLVVESLPVLVSVRDADSGRFVSINRAGELITGLQREQVVGRTWHEIYGRQFADLYAELDRRAIAAGHQVERPRDVWLRADGRTLTVNQRVVPLFEAAFDADGQVHPAARYVMSIVDDLTGEVTAEAALKETETRFRQFAENIDQVVFVALADLTAVLFVNARYAELTGAPPSELLEDPRRALDHVHPDDAGRISRALPRVIARLRRLKKCELTMRLASPTRGERQVSVRLNPVRMHDGTVRVFGIADDVTERAAAERQRIAEAVKQRDILVREVHHRIKNNLQGVAGLLQHMATAKPEIESTLNEIAGQIQAIAQVHGLQIRATGTLPVLGVVQGIFRSLGAMFGATVRVDTPQPALWRWGLPENEAVPLALVVNELGTNAIKYRASRDSSLAVRVDATLGGVAIQIENPGRLPALFDLDRIASGMSGLALVKALLPRRGARLSIEQVGAVVRARLELTPPAIGEDLGEDVGRPMS